MNYQRAIVETDKTATEENQLIFLYWTSEGWFITNHYDENWLFRAYPGGRRELSQAGKDLLDMVENSARN